MTKCSKCKKEYETYPELMNSTLEGFIIYNHIKDMYYDDENDEGLCKKCREELWDNPSEVYGWFLVALAELYLIETKDEMKDKKKVKDAIKRVKKRMDELKEKIPKCKWCGVFYVKEEKEGISVWKPQCDDNKELCLLTKKKMDEERNDNRTEKEMKDVDCVYCSEFKGQKFIPNPNGMGERWWICLTCEKVIKEQQKLSFGVVMSEHNKELGEKIVKEAQKKIDELEYESGTPILNLKFKKDKDGKYKVSEI